jgi:MoaA/NifB/PqqE/SkfB family radical SAM enzyme
MARVLILHPPTWLPPDFVDVPPFTILGAFDLLAELLARGHEATLRDALVTGTPFLREGSWLRLGASVDELLEAASGVDAEWIAVQRTPYHRLTRNVTHVLDPLLAGLARRNARVVLFDGHLGETHYVQDDATRVLRRHPGVTAVAPRESSYAVAELLEGRRTRGVAVNPACTLRLADARERPDGGSALHDLPLDHLDVPAYVARFRDLAEEDLILEVHDRAAVFPVQASRGCPFQCRFCTREDGRRWEARSLDAFEADAVRLQAAGVECLHVVDAIANLDADRFDDLLDRVAGLGLSLAFPNGLRVDRLREGTIPRLARVARELTVSVESADEHVRTAGLRKPLDLGHAEAMVAAAHAHGLPVSVHWILGTPGEDAVAANRTVLVAADWFERHAARPLVQAYVDPARLQVPPGADGLPDDAYAAFHEPPAEPDLRARLVAIGRKQIEHDEAKLIINLSYACNNSCVFCSVGDRPRRDGDFDLQFSEIRAAWARGIRLLDLDGGEPTLYPRLFDLIGAARGVGFERITVTTNGRRLAYRSFAARLAATGVQVLVSLHGSTPEVHEALTRAPGSFRQTFTGLATALGLFADVGVNTTVVRGNVADLPALGARLARLGVHRWTLQALTPFGNARGEQAIDAEEARAAFEAVVHQLGERLAITVIGLPYCQLPGLEAHVLDDHFKMVREMLFVDGRRVNLGRYLAERRRHEPVSCDPCPWRVICNGFWRFPDDPALPSDLPNGCPPP